MKLQEWLEKAKKAEEFHVISEGDREKTISRVFCCDLLSVAMSKVPEGGIWVTVIANMNTLAVAALTEASCVILAEGARVDESFLKKAEEEQLCLIQTELPVFEAASLADLWIGGDDRVNEGKNYE